MKNKKTKQYFLYFELNNLTNQNIFNIIWFRLFCEEFMNQKILVVEAQENLRAELIKSLKNEGFSDVSFDIDGSKTFNILKNEKIDLIILDIDLKAVNGFLICNRIKKQPATADIPIIILSEKQTESAFEKHKATDTPATDYIHLPVSTDMIIKSAKKIFGIIIEEPVIEQIKEEDDDIFEVNDSIIENMKAEETFDVEIEKQDEPLTSPDFDVVIENDNPFEIAHEESIEVEIDTIQDNNDPDGLSVNENDVFAKTTNASFNLDEDGLSLDNDVKSTYAKNNDSLDSTISNDLSAQVEEREVIIRNLKEQLDEKTSLIYQLKDEANKVPNIEKALKEQDSLISSLNKEIDNLKSNYKKLEETKTQTTVESGGNVNREIVKLKQELSHKEREIVDYRERFNSKEKELLDLQDKLNEIEMTVVDKDEVIEQKELEITTLKSKAEELSAENQKHLLKIADIENSNSVLTNEKNALIEEKSNLEKEKNELTNQVNKQIEELDVYIGMVEKQKSEIDGYLNHLSDLEIKHSALINEKNTVDEKNRVLNDKIAQIEDANKKLFTELTEKHSNLQNNFNELQTKYKNAVADRHDAESNARNLEIKLEQNLEIFKQTQIEKDKIKQLLAAAVAVIDGIVSK